MITNNTKYGLKAILFLVKNEKARIQDIVDHEIAPKEEISAIFQKLEAAGLIRPSSSNHFSLTRPAEKITVGEVVRTIDGPLAPIPCVSHTAYKRCGDCPSEEACEVRRLMRLVRDATAYILDTTSIIDMGAGRNPLVVFDKASMELSSPA